MGLVLSVWKRFRRKATTKEVLESIEEKIQGLESSLHRNKELEKRTALSLILFSISVYLVAAGIFYLWFLPDNWSDRFIWILPFMFFPLLVVILKRTLHFIFVTRINKHAKQLDELNKQKKEILEDVMDNEIYKVAKELLAKYDPHGRLVERETDIKSPSPVRKPIGPGQELRQRPNVMKSGQSNTPLAAPGTPQGPMPSPRRPPLVHQSKSVSLPPARVPSPLGNGQNMPINSLSNLMDTPSMSSPNLLNCPILPRERSFFDKVAEYFIGDGPSHRYALICKQCFSHNGMALEDEFEYIAFRCCYCNTFNPSRKNRLNAPSLEEMNDDASETSSTGTVESVRRLDQAKERKTSIAEVSTEEEATENETDGKEDITNVDEEPTTTESS